MTTREQMYCKRMAMGMTQKEFAAIADVSEGIISLFERGEWIPPVDYTKIKCNVEGYIRHFDREKYLKTRIREETIMLGIEPEEEHLHTTSHLMIHVSKLNMMYACMNDRKEESY